MFNENWTFGQLVVAFLGFLRLAFPVASLAVGIWTLAELVKIRKLLTPPKK